MRGRGGEETTVRVERKEESNCFVHRLSQGKQNGEGTDMTDKQQMQRNLTEKAQQGGQQLDAIKEMGSELVVGKDAAKVRLACSEGNSFSPGPPPPSPPPPPRSPEAARHTYKATKQFFHSTPELLPFS